MVFRFVVDQPLPAWLEGPLADVWWRQEGVSGICRCWWQYGQRSMRCIRLRIHCWWWRCIVEHKTPGNRLFVHNREWVYCRYSCCEGGALALFFNYASFRSSHSSHYFVLGQPVGNRACKRSPIPPTHQTHWCSIPFYPLGRWRRQNPSYTLSYWWHGGRYSYKGPPLA